MVVTVAALLASVMMLQVGGFRERALVSTMKADLRSFAVAQESYYYDNSVYTPDTVALFAREYRTSRGTTLDINEATVAGWAVTALHSPGTSRRCYLFIPGASPVGVATRPGVIECG